MYKVLITYDNGELDFYCLNGSEEMSLETAEYVKRTINSLKLPRLVNVTIESV